MTYEKFVENLKQDKFPLTCLIKSSDTWKTVISPITKTTSDDELTISWRFEIGGTRGGNCWGYEAESYVVLEVEENSLLDSYLNKYYPEISFLKYKSLLKSVSSYSQYESDYYGNSTEYLVKYILLKDLYEFFYSAK